MTLPSLQTPMNAVFAGRHSMDTPEWYTPTVFVEAARLAMGGIDLDPASHPEANERLKILRIFTENDNGLKQDWFGNVFINPPGGLVAEFWRKLLKEWQIGRVSQVVWIGYSLEQLQTLQNISASHTPLDFATCFTKKRIAFVENTAKQALRVEKLRAQGKKPSVSSSPSHSNYITYLGARRDEFREAFSQFGQVVQP